MSGGSCSFTMGCFTGICEIHKGIGHRVRTFCRRNTKAWKKYINLKRKRWINHNSTFYLVFVPYDFPVCSGEVIIITVYTELYVKYLHIHEILRFHLVFILIDRWFWYTWCILPVHPMTRRGRSHGHSWLRRTLQIQIQVQRQVHVHIQNQMIYLFLLTEK